MSSRRSAVWSAVLVMVTVLLSLLASAAPSGAAGPATVVYDSIPSPLPGNIVSLGYQATATSAFGDDVRLADGPRTLDTVTVGMSSWALHAGVNNSAPGADSSGWDQQLTLDLYRSTGPANAPVVGALLAAQSRTFHVPWRPAADPTCANPTQWKDGDGACWNGKAFTVTFDLSSAAVTLPSRLIATVAFNTQSYGSVPVGADGPWNSLNVGAQGTSASVGTDVSNDVVLWDSTYGGRPAGLSPDTGWTGNGPTFRITATGPAATTSVVREAQVAATAGAIGVSTPWFRNDTGLGGAATFVNGPGTPPAGVGSLGLSTTDSTSHAQLYGYQFIGTRLDAISSLSYRTYRASGPGSIVPSLNLEVDYAGTGSSYTTLVFEPVYNPTQGAVTDGTWQTWDATSNGSGIWWSTSSIPGVNKPADGCGVTPCYVTWDTIIASNPNAKIRFGVGPNVGTGVSTPFAGSADGLAVGVDGAVTTFDFEPTCSTNCYVSPSGSNSNGGTSFADAKLTIQAGIDAVTAGGTVHVDDGTYAESPNITKSLTLISKSGRDLTEIDLQVGPTYTGALTVGGSDVTIDGFTIVGRDGAAPSTLAASNIFLNSGLHDVVITNNRIKVGAIDPVSTNGDDGFGILTTYAPSDHLHSLSVTGNIFVPLNTSGTRAFYLNPGIDGFTFTGNTVTGTFDRSAVTQARDGLVEGNTITGTGGSAGFGTWGYPDATQFGKTDFHANSITGTAAGFRIRGTNDVTIRNNVVSGVADGVVVDDVPGDGLTAQLDGSTVVIRDNSFSGITGHYVTNTYAGAVNASVNWWGSTNTAAPNISGPVDFTPVLTSGVDTSGAAGFQGSVAGLKVHASGAQLGTEGRIQEGIDTTVTDGTIDVAPGAYSETATHRDPALDTATPGYQFGLFFPNAKTGITVRGVTGADAPITDPNATQAVVTTNATNNFGYSGIFVAGDHTTIQGLEIGTNSPSSDKTFEVIADDFSFLDSFLNDLAGAIYFGDWTDASVTSRIATYHIDGNRFAADNSITHRQRRGSWPSG